MFELCLDLLRLMRFILLDLPQLVLAFLACCWLALIVWLHRGRQASRHITGGQAAATILAAHNLGTRVFRGDGWLVDSYHPKKDAIVLSAANFDGTDIGALAIAAHETGHALHAHRWFAPYCLLRFLEPIARIALGASFWLWLIGSAAENQDLLRAAAATLGTYLLYLILELICEFDASRRGVRELIRHGFLQPDESRAARRILQSALATYFAAFAGSTAAVMIFLLPILGHPIRTPAAAQRAQSDHRSFGWAILSANRRFATHPLRLSRLRSVGVCLGPPGSTETAA